MAEKKAKMFLLDLFYMLENKQSILLMPTSQPHRRVTAPVDRLR